jgi:hypothetical protein
MGYTPSLSPFADAGTFQISQWTQAPAGASRSSPRRQVYPSERGRRILAVRRECTRDSPTGCESIRCDREGHIASSLFSWAGTQTTAAITAIAASVDFMCLSGLIMTVLPQVIMPRRRRAGVSSRTGGIDDRNQEVEPVLIGVMSITETGIAIPLGCR